MTDSQDAASSEGRTPQEGSGPLSFPEELIRFVDLVREERFWDSHEVLEDPWREAGSDFYHGLILFASAFVHAKRGNAHGIGAQLRKALPYLDAHRPFYLGVDVEELIVHARRCLAILDEREEDPPGEWKEIIPFPSPTLDPERIRGDEPELGESARKSPA